MCGIAGIARSRPGPLDPDLLHAMAAALEHRGPDAHGRWTGEGRLAGTGLAHTRLSIIDPDGSPQPMTSHDGRYVISFNGEVLNYRELRAELDYPWSTNGDTEVLLAAFAAHGPRAFAMLAGQFACAVLDTVTGELWLARDRTGILPLYWWADAERFAFASEIKALTPVAGPLAVDEAGLDEYLLRRAVPAPGTLVEGVRKLPPGHVLRVAGGRPGEPEPYWRPAVGDLLDLPPAEAVRRVEEVLLGAVGRNLVADVPVGCYLSGGLDSSLITAMTVAVRGGREKTSTFSAGFGDPRYDELGFARLVADRLETAHHPVPVREDDFAALWPLLTWHRDAPVSEPADVAVYKLARAASDHVTVVLSGEGADELFAGYPKHAYAGLSAAAARVPAALRERPLGRLQHALPRRAHRARIAVRALAGRTPEDVLAGWFAPFSAAERRRLTGRTPSSPGRTDPGADPLSRMLLADLDAWLPDNLLERGDRMSMAASIELRPPFLDREVVDLAFRLPSDLKLRGRSGKWVVKEVARRYLPGTIVDRPKSGFRVPLDTWFRGGLRPMAWDLLTSRDSLVTTALDPREVRRLLVDHDSGRRNEDIRLWTLLSLEVWHRTCLRGEQPAPRPAPSGLRVG